MTWKQVMLFVGGLLGSGTTAAGLSHLLHLL
jgi:hypothetical protein